VRTAGVVLAAGGGTRFLGPTHKLLALHRGRPLVAAVLDAAADAGFDGLAVVTGAVRLGDLVPDGAVEIENDRWGEGLSTSLAAAVAWADGEGFDAIVVGLGDMPGVPTSAWSALAAASGPVAVASFDGALRPPVRLARSVWGEVPTSGDVGARALWHRPGTVEVPCAGNPIDVDTADDLERLDRTTGGS
jgi:molybdenum cofactor cytidylyltransferase